MNALSSTSARAESVHQDLLAAVQASRATEHRCAVLLAEMARDRLYLSLGYAGVVAYAMQALELTSRKVRALLQLGRMLPSLPALDAAFAAGEVGWTKARELLRVVTPETEAAWVERAKEVDSRALERLVSVSPVPKGGRLPPAESPPDKGESRVRLVFEVEACDAQVIRDAIALVRAQSGVNRAELGDGTLLAQLAQRFVHDEPDGTAPTGVAGERYRIVLEACPSCGNCSGRDHDVSETVALES